MVFHSPFVSWAVGKGRPCHQPELSVCPEGACVRAGKVNCLVFPLIVGIEEGVGFLLRFVLAFSFLSVPRAHDFQTFCA